MPFDGFAIGGLAVGEEKHQREDVCEFTAALLPEDRPRYLMGVGMPIDLLEAVHRGMDMFDCIIPTQVAKRGTAFTSRGIVELRRSVYKFADTPLDAACTCPVCATHSRAYLHHLTKTQETLGWTLVGQHNIHFYHQLMREIRVSILEDRFLPLYHEKRAILAEEDLDHPVKPPKRGANTAVSEIGRYELHGSSIRVLDSDEIVPTSIKNDLPQLTKLLHEKTDEPLIVWDIGLGAGAAAISAVLAYEAAAQKQAVRPMHIISIADDRDALKLALSHKKIFPWLRHGAADTLLHRGAWKSRFCQGLSWSLASENEPPKPDLILHTLIPGMQIDLSAHECPSVEFIG
jgi:queuine tRNA-ribosyltransferase